MSWSVELDITTRMLDAARKSAELVRVELLGELTEAREIIAAKDQELEEAFAAFARERESLSAELSELKARIAGLEK